MPRPLHRVLVANRGEIALRAVRAARSLGMETVAVHSTADAASPHVFAADRAVCIGPPPPAESYLDIEALVHVARATKCDGVYPGYGFLSERAAFARRCADAGLIFVGPSARAIATMGDKTAARQAAARLGVPLVPGSEEAFGDVAAAAATAGSIGFPLLLKARAGGGGRGMRVCPSAAEFTGLFEQATREAAAAFGDGAIYLERFFAAVRHIEVQIFGDAHGNVRALGERDCSVQRRHQKLIEEGPSPVLDDDGRNAMQAAAVALAQGVGYVGAGTVEFIYDETTGNFYFIEMNTRIQVEHPVTEQITGSDLIVEQLRVARGEPLSIAMPDGGPSGHAIEFRINAEDWRHGFRPGPGRLTRWRPPSGPGIRVDSGVYEGFEVSPFYDSLLAKLVVHGASRQEALARARRALADFEVCGLTTTMAFHAAVLDDEDFSAGRIHTRWVETAFLPRVLG
jgi:acetyl-CoA carboxylase biotin carboxylase subunit